MKDRVSERVANLFADKDAIAKLEEAFAELKKSVDAVEATPKLLVFSSLNSDDFKRLAWAVSFARLLQIQRDEALEVLRQMNDLRESQKQVIQVQDSLRSQLEDAVLDNPVAAIMMAKSGISRRMSSLETE